MNRPETTALRAEVNAVISGRPPVHSAFGANYLIDPPPESGWPSLLDWHFMSDEARSSFLQNMSPSARAWQTERERAIACRHGRRSGFLFGSLRWWRKV